MKKATKILSTALALICTFSVLMSCDSTEDSFGKNTDKKNEKVLTVEEIYQKLASADNFKFTVTYEISMEIDSETMTVESETVVERDENKGKYTIRSSTDSSIGGADEQETVLYYEVTDGKSLWYTRDDNGNWSTGESEQIEVLQVSDFESLFKNDSFGDFDRERSKYVMNSDVSIDIENYGTVTDATLAVGNDLYTLRFTATMLGISCAFEVSFSDFDEVTVTLPL